MGPCHSKSKESHKKTQSVKVGGGDNGTCTWILLNGIKVEQLNKLNGWEMKFDVDDKGGISGGNKNDVDGSLKKTYSGTFSDGKLDAMASFEDGGQIKYTGIVDGALMKVTCLVVKGNVQFHEGDTAECVGAISYN